MNEAWFWFHVFYVSLLVTRAATWWKVGGDAGRAARLLSPRRKTKSHGRPPHNQKPKTSFNMDDSVAGEAAPPPTTTIQPLATERTRGDAIYSDWAFEICMPHAARLQRRLLCVFSEDVTATGTRLEKKKPQKTTSHRCIFSVILLRHWHSSTW